MKADPEWHKSFFRNSFYNPATRWALAAAPAETAFLCRAMRLKKGMSLIDVCCGPGRHSVEFARRDILVTGFDFSEEYLSEAAARARKDNLDIRFSVGDMREIPYTGEFDAAVSLFNSFGYFKDRKDDMKVLLGIFRSLRPGGKFALDIVNGTNVRKYSRHQSKTDLGRRWLTDKIEFTDDGMTCSWTFTDKKTGKSQTEIFFNRLYDEKLIRKALSEAGFGVLKIYGSFDGEKLTDKSERIIAISQKPV